MVNLLRRGTLEEAVLAFLRAEWKSPSSRKHLDVTKVSAKILEDPNLSDPAENLRRWQALGSRQRILGDLPGSTEWWVARIGRDELKGLSTGGYKLWKWLSAETRLVLKVAETIHRNGWPPSPGEELREELADAREAVPNILRDLKCGKKLDPLLLVGSAVGGPFRVIEGTKRATALCLLHCLKGAVCEGIDALLGISPETAL